MTNDIVKVLRDHADDLVVNPIVDNMCRKAANEIERLRGLLRRALPMADALDATKTAVVWMADMQCDASGQQWQAFIDQHRAMTQVKGIVTKSR